MTTFKTLLMGVFVVIFNTFGFAQQDSLSNKLNKIIILDTIRVDPYKIVIDTYLGLNVNTTYSQPNLQELVYVGITLKSFRQHKLGIIFGIYSESYKQDITLDIIDQVNTAYPQVVALKVGQIGILQQFNIESTLTYNIKNNINFNLYAVLSANMTQIILTAKDALTKNNVATFNDHILYSGGGLLFDIVTKHVDATIMPTVGYYTSDYLFDKGFYYKMRFDIRDIIKNFSIGSSYVKLKKSNFMFINISYRIKLKK